MFDVILPNLEALLSQAVNKTALWVRNRHIEQREIDIDSKDMLLCLQPGGFLGPVYRAERQ